MVADDDQTLNPYAPPELDEPSSNSRSDEPLEAPLIAIGPVSLDQYRQAREWIEALQRNQNRWTATAATITTAFGVLSLAITGGWPMSILFGLLAANGWHQWWKRRKQAHATREAMPRIPPQAIRFRIINGGGLVIDATERRQYVDWSQVRCHTFAADGTQLVLSIADDCQVFTSDHFEEEADWFALREAVGYYVRPA